MARCTFLFEVFPFLLRFDGHMTTKTDYRLCLQRQARRRWNCSSRCQANFLIRRIPLNLLWFSHTFSEALILVSKFCFLMCVRWSCRPSHHVTITDALFYRDCCGRQSAMFGFRFLCYVWRHCKNYCCCRSRIYTAGGESYPESLRLSECAQ